MLKWGLSREKRVEEKRQVVTYEGLPGFDHPHSPAPRHTLHQPLAAFDANAEAWEDYTFTPLGRLRQELTLRQMAQHLGPLPRSLKVLDAGGGTASYALPLAQQGHQVCLLDFSARMLTIARQKVEQLAPSLLERIDFCHASVEETPSLFRPDYFDLILCHTLLEYVSEPWGVLRTLTTVLQPGGLISLLLANSYADALRWALARGDLEKARLALRPSSGQALRERVSSADLFGLPRRTFPTEVVQEALVDAGVEVVAEYGVRIFADYLPAEKLADSEFFARLLELEAAAGALDPYRLIARYIHLLGRKAHEN
jgi:S-adenosylmethionine-dependent methyltransferase